MSESNNTLLKFPEKSIKRIVPKQLTSIEEGDIELKKLIKLKYILVNEYLSVIIPPIFNVLMAAGIEFGDLKKSKDATMIVESIKSMLEKHYEIENPLQEVNQKLFMEDEDGSLTFANNFHIIVDKKEKEEENNASKFV